MNTAKIEDGIVYRDGESIGQVNEVDWHTNTNGRVRTVTKFEARREHQLLTVSPLGTFPCFDTEAEAVDYLANGRA